MKRLYTLAIATLLCQSVSYGQGWQPLGNGSETSKTKERFFALIYDNGTLYSAPHGKWNGKSWEDLGGQWLSEVMCVDKDHNLYNPGPEGVIKWDGTQWSKLGIAATVPLVTWQIEAICADNKGNIYAAGIFKDTTDGVFNVAKWDGTAWSQVGTGSNALHANGHIKRLAADSHGNIYAAGEFTHGEYVYVAMWDGTAWGQVGAGDNPLNVKYFPGAEHSGGIVSLYVDQADNVYAAANVWWQYAYVTKWKGNSWTIMGDRTVPDRYNGWRVVLEHIDLLAGNKAGDIYIAAKDTVKKWGGNSWVTLGTGRAALCANSDIMSLCADDAGNVYAAGDFSDERSKFDGGRYVAVYNTRDSTPMPEVENIDVWPNPAHNVLYIKGPEFNENIYLYDISGALKKTILNRVAPSAGPAIDLSDMSAGTYFLRSKDCNPVVFRKY